MNLKQKNRLRRNPPNSGGWLRQLALVIDSWRLIATGYEYMLRNPVEFRETNVIVAGVRVYSDDPTATPYRLISYLKELDLPDKLHGLSILISPKSPYPIGRGIRGWYYGRYRLAWVKQRSNADDLLLTALHEVGHHLWGTLSIAERICFMQSTRALRGGRNDWSNPEERFCDGFAIGRLGIAETSAEETVADKALEILYAENRRPVASEAAGAN